MAEDGTSSQDARKNKFLQQVSKIKALVHHVTFIQYKKRK